MQADPPRRHWLSWMEVDPLPKVHGSSYFGALASFFIFFLILLTMWGALSVWSATLCMFYAFSPVKIFECYNSSWGSSSVGTSLAHSCFSLCISYISLNITFRAFALFLFFFSIEGFFCRQFSYVFTCFATTMSMATSFYYSYLWIATPCVTFVFCFMTICNNYFLAWFFFFFVLFCILMCVFVMLFVGNLQLQPHKHPQSTCF
jgi:hypothetical protein